MTAKVLIIDDEMPTVRLLAHTLQNRGYVPITATSGAEGVALALDEGPDVVLLDIMMPEMNGFQVARALRNEPRTAQIGIIIISASGDRDIEARSRSAGADWILPKPVRLQVLFAAIEGVLEARQT